MVPNVTRKHFNRLAKDKLKWHIHAIRYCLLSNRRNIVYALTVNFCIIDVLFLFSNIANVYFFWVLKTAAKQQKTILKSNIFSFCVLMEPHYQLQLNKQLAHNFSVIQHLKLNISIWFCKISSELHCRKHISFALNR